MKKIFLLFALMGIVAIGCSKDEIDKDKDKDNENKTEQPNENEEGDEEDMPESIFFGLDKESVTISPDGGSVDIVVYSNYKWEISGTSDWCTPSITKGDANEDGQKVTFSADVAYDDREATFWFRCADEKIKFVVSQKFKEVIIPDANNSFDISAEGGIAVISYKTSVDCEVIIPEEAQDWITIAPATRGLVSEDINLDIAQNTTYDPRSAVIKVVAKDNAELVVEYTINQEQNNVLLVDGNNTFTVPSTGGKVVINYQTNLDCEVIIPEEAQDWITIAPAKRGLVTYNTTLNITANNSGKQRSSVVKVVSQDHNELFAEYTITQNTRCCLYYTSNNGKIVKPNNSSSFDAGILSNTYKNGVGEIEFNAPLTTIGLRAFRDCSNLTSVTIPDSVTEIGMQAFYKCSNLTSINIPDSVTSIGSSAFEDCRSLSSVTIPNSVTSIGGSAFSGCSSLKSVTIPNSVTSIGDGAFYDCSRLRSVTIPNSVTSIGGSAFKNCWGEFIIDSKIIEKDYENSNYPSYDSNGWLYDAKFTKLIIGDNVTKIGNNAFRSSRFTSVTIGNGVTSIGDYAFRYCSSLTSVTIPNGVTSIGGSAFYGCSSLTSVTIGNGVTSIGSDTFYGCSSLIGVTIPNSATSIGSDAFNGCSSLIRVTIPDSVTSIGDGAFYNCSRLKSVAIPNSVTSIGDDAFLYCSGLTSVTIGNGVTSIGDYAFYGCTGELTVNCNIPSGSVFKGSEFTKITIGNSVTSIGGSAFQNCEGELKIDSKIVEKNYESSNYPSYDSNGWLYGAKFTKLTIGDNITKIGDYAFKYCNKLTSVTIPNSVTSIGDSAFQHCSSIQSVAISNSVTSIGDSAFQYCSSLKSVYCKPVTPPTGGSSMFDSNASRREIYVPYNSASAYKSADGWNNYESYIVGADI